MLSRRELLIGAASIAGLQALKPLRALAQENPARPFLYTLEDYINPAKQPPEMGRLYLDELKEPAVLVSWATWCLPCPDKIPRYNQLYQRYGERIRFLGALQEDNIGFFPEPPPMPAEEYMALCVYNSLVFKYGYGSEAYEEAMQQLRAIRESRENKITSPELAEMVRTCEENTREAYHPTPHRPKERQRLTNTGERWSQQGKWPLFPTYILDNEATSQYLGGETAFFVTLFKNGKKIKTLEGRVEQRIERELRRL